MPRPIDIAKMTDREIAAAILRRDTAVTKEYLYNTCRKQFQYLFFKYYSDCESWIEFVNEIYLFILVPKKNSNQNRLSQFDFRCKLSTWLYVVAENYCRQLYARRADIFDKNYDVNDRFDLSDQSIFMDLQTINMEDLKKILNLMPNQRYRALIEYRYLQGHSNEETAAYLNMNMANFYNKHKLAKAQFVATLRKEERS